MILERFEEFNALMCSRQQSFSILRFPSARKNALDQARALYNITHSALFRNITQGGERRGVAYSQISQHFAVHFHASFFSPLIKRE